MTPHPQNPQSAVKVTTGTPAPTLPKCPTFYGVIDMLTPPWLPARKGTRRGYVDQGAGCPIGNSVTVPGWWVDVVTKREVDWKLLHEAAKAYPRDAFIGVDIEEPWNHDPRKTDASWPMRALDSRNLIARVVAEIKAVRPDLIVGVYATIPNLYWESLDAKQLDAWKKAAEFNQKIIDAVDVVMPVSYPHYDRDDNNDSIDIASDNINIDNEVGEALKLANGKPVVPWISAKIYDGAMVKSRDVSAPRWRNLNERIRSLGCAGVAMWGFNGGALPGIHESIMFDEAIKIWGGRMAA